jgi:hypothetical protein
VRPRQRRLPEPIAQKKMTFQASIAEFLLVNRLRARKRAEPSADVLERASRIVFVTCKNWFAAPRGGPDHRSIFERCDPFFFFHRAQAGSHRFPPCTLP